MYTPTPQKPGDATYIWSPPVLEKNKKEFIMKDRYTHKTYGCGFGVNCSDKSKSDSVLNYLITGYPLAGQPLDGVSIEFVGGEHDGKTGVFRTELYMEGV